MQSGESQVRFDLQPENGVAAQRTPLWPMFVGIIVTAWALDFVVSWLPRGSMARFGLLILAVMLLFTAVMVCGFVVRAVYARLLPGKRPLATPAIRAACLTALWIPAWVLFVETWSLLMIAAGVLCLLTLGWFLKRCEIAPVQVDAASQPHEPGTPFLFDGTPLARLLLPSLLLVLLFDAAIALAANRWFVVSSIAAGVFAGVLAWRAATRRVAISGAPQITQKPVISNGGQAGILTTAFLLTLVALLPYLRVGQKRSGILGPTNATKASAATPKDGASSSDGYVGVILLPLSEPQKKIIAPVQHDLVPHFGVKIAEPMEIPFDGQYWYFKWPDKRPRPTARMVRGSSTKVQVSSSDRYPLLMEAHQKLAQPMDLGCCSAMDLVVENADQQEGAIALELWVKKLPDAAASAKQRVNAVALEQVPRYLGTVTIPSSELPMAQRLNPSGKQTEEKLQFPIPAAMDGMMFDEITVVVRTAPERARMGAKVAIKKFVLEP
ncbi:hypothetical protein [Edaphobacter albus]|uniref:hypothetical protein n=1 Tax=Edaphobacter sp. 4G125 TaxID=2763071 RepID=UPI0016471BE3|nr:hypothetical protein [Edaphobacter sp. 4G125]QNI36702.1 hypothetical protein H7846_17460 [Edaphobacter sp. 4G125]